MPGKSLEITVPPNHVLMIEGTAWSPDWRAPDTAQTLSAQLMSGFDTIATINIFVLEPRSNIDAKGWLNGYRIGTYPRNPPEGFIKLNGPNSGIVKRCPKAAHDKKRVRISRFIIVERCEQSLKAANIILTNKNIFRPVVWLLFAQKLAKLKVR